jgi:hypothetical protein
VFLPFRKRNLSYRAWYSIERRLKELLFGCSMCGQCVLRSVALTCPMQCPKQMRNGPCGGSMDGHCEVYPEKPCVWAMIQRRAGRFAWTRRKLRDILPAPDWSLYGTAALLNIWPERTIATNGRARSPAPVPSPNRWELLGEQNGTHGNNGKNGNDGNNGSYTSHDSHESPPTNHPPEGSR